MRSILPLALSLPLTFFSLSSAATPRPSLWKPIKGQKWQIVLNGTIGPIDSTVAVYDVDLYDTDPREFAALKAANKKIICYFSAGSVEEWRDDAGQFNESDYGADLPGWGGEKWLNTESANVRRIMKKRIEDAADKGCDAVDPDNVDAFDNPETRPLNLTEATAISYLGFLANTTARPLNLAIGLKNSLKIVPQVASWLDFQVNEECIAPPGDNPTDPRGPNECDKLKPFIRLEKPVFHIEYDERVPDGAPGEVVSKFCDRASTEGFSNIIKDMEVTSRTRYCP
ncbi:glycoside hydrolase superfamily [Halenospora varia]|nr:glycoside hydrolase superfamily [Halenospora varia]